jgi:hypothetical protein
MRGMLRDSIWLEEQREAVADRAEAVVDRAKEFARTASDKVGTLTHKQNRAIDPNEPH